jgi:hypothetical protein
MRNLPPIIFLIFWDVLALAAFACTIHVVATPTRKLLEWDRRTGYQIYKFWLKRHGNDENAVNAAGWYYKIFGNVVLIFLGAQIIAATGMILVQIKTESASPTATTAPPGPK